MKDTAPISEGIIAVSILFGIVGGGVAFVMYDFGMVGAVFVGALVAAIAAILFALGWRAPASHGPRTPGDIPNTATAPAARVSTAPATPAAAPAPASSAPATEPVAASAAPAAEAKPVAADGKPDLLTAAREGGPDDLKQIKGVGPKLEKLLHSMGVFHFDQIASWRAKEVGWVDENLEGFKGRVSRDNWVSQAKTLAAGGETEFSKKVGKGGVY